MNQDHYIGDVVVTKTLNREQYVSDVVAAKIMGCSPQSLRNWRCTGARGPAYSKKGRMIRNRVQDLLDFMASGRIDPEGRHRAHHRMQACPPAGDFSAASAYHQKHRRPRPRPGTGWRRLPGSGPEGPGGAALVTADSIRQALQCGEPGCACQKPCGKVHCPVHEDTPPSLSVTEKNGKVLVKCFGGCSQDRAIAALRSPPLSAPGEIFSRGKWKKNEKEKK